MKKLAIVFGMMGLASAAQADNLTPGLEMQTFLRCNPAHVIPDAGVEVELRQERVGNYRDAVLTSSTIAGPHSELYAHLNSRPLIVEGDEAVGTIYTASNGRKQLKLTVDFSQGNGDTSPAVLELGGFKRDLVCQHFMVLM